MKPDDDTPASLKLTITGGSVRFTAEQEITEEQFDHLLKRMGKDPDLMKAIAQAALKTARRTDV